MNYSKSKTATNSNHPKGGVSCFNDSFVVTKTLVFQIKFCGNSPSLRLAANRYRQWWDNKRNEKIVENEQH